MADRRRSSVAGSGTPRTCDARPDRRHAGAKRRQQKPASHGGSHQALEDRHMTVFVYVNTSKQVGDAEHIKVFANADAAETWFAENDPEGVAFEYEVLE